MRFTPENDIPTSSYITQVSRDAFWLNGVPTKDDGNVVIEKTGGYTYSIYIDRINWSKYHDLIQAGDVVLIQGKWEATHETTTFDVTITPIYLRYTGSGWERLETYDIYLNLSIDQGRKNNKDELYLTPTAENPIPHSGWSIRANSSANECLMVNDVAAPHSSQLIKVLEYTYLVYLPDAQVTISSNDEVKLQGIYTYSTALLSFHVHVTTIVVKWNGTEWVNGLQDSSADQLEAGNLLSNIGRTRADGNHATSVKNFDQSVVWDADLGEEVDTLVYKKDENGHTGIYFTSSSGNDGEFRVYFPGNAYKAESKGYAMTQLTFDYIYKNDNEVGVNSRNHSITQDGNYVAAAQGVTNNFTVQALLNNNSSNMYYDIEVTLVNDGALHSVTLNLAYGDVMGFGFKVWDFNGKFFMSNVHADYQEYNANLDAMYGLLKMYENYNNPGGYTSCEDYYAAAKAGYLALSDGEKALFNTNVSYASARARLAAWAVANGETFDTVNGTFSLNTNMLPFNSANNMSLIAIIVLAAGSSVVLLGVLLTLKKRRKHN